MKLNITLGHNSSAGLFTEDGVCLCAYEEERLTKVKSDSSFPKLAIEECIRRTNTNPLDIRDINLSHWFNDKAGNDKYSDLKYLQRRFRKAYITDELNHHDQHAQSVWNFSGTTDGLTLVIDGFGNNEEVISVYRNGHIIHKVVGYEHSLGLMYQYATSAAGLKENEDEYKLLGYEIHSTIEPKLIHMPIIKGFYLDMVSKLKDVKQYWHNELANMSREDIARTVQFNLEQRVLKIVHSYLNDGELLQLSGGVFYNVKLNNAIMRSISGKLCVNPVCGDQGNIFGVGGLEYNKLDLGLRDITYVLPTNDDITESFYGNMEFGPRALCNTSTLAIPTMDNVETINSYNNRNTVMPMAPVVTREFFNTNFNDTNKIVKSEKFMVISFDFKEMKDEWRGGAHYDPIRDVYTGRVQVLDSNDIIYGYVKSRGGIMINTSLNYHGTPILFDNNDLRFYHHHISS